MDWKVYVGKLLTKREKMATENKSRSENAMELSEKTQDSDDGTLFVSDFIIWNCLSFCFWGLIFIYFWLRMLMVPNHEKWQRELSCRSVVEIPKRWICHYYGSKLLFSELNGVCRLEPANAHHFEADPIMWVDWESFSTWHERLQTPKTPSRYVIRVIVCCETFYSGNYSSNFRILIN